MHPQPVEVEPSRGLARGIEAERPAFVEAQHEGGPTLDVHRFEPQTTPQGVDPRPDGRAFGLGPEGALRHLLVVEARRSRGQESEERTETGHGSGFLDAWMRGWTAAVAVSYSRRPRSPPNPGALVTAKTPADPARFRQSLLRLLLATPKDEDKLLAQFEGRRVEGEPLYSSLLFILAHLSFPESEAERHFRRVLSHRETLRGQLGRDPGLRVALLDYFQNVSRELENPLVIELKLYERTERSAVTDGLTGLFNHTYFKDALRREVQRARRHGFKISLALFDLDDFKRLNDTKGHLAGDRVLVKAASLLKESAREIDVAARWGGEEFALILPETRAPGPTWWPSAFARASSRTSSAGAGRRSRSPAGSRPGPRTRKAPRSSSARPIRECTGPRRWARTAW